MNHLSWRSKWTMTVAAFTWGSSVGWPWQRQGRPPRGGTSWGPVTLGPGDILIVAVANASVAPSCREAAFVRFVEHVLERSEASPNDGSSIVVNQVVKAELGAARVASGQSAKIRVSAGRGSRTTTVQVHVETERLTLGVAPCINLGGTVVWQDSSIRAGSPAQFADDFSILRPNSEATCVGSASCDDLLDLCEQNQGCSFTCHIAIPNPSGQACVFGSTD